MTEEQTRYQPDDKHVRPATEEEIDINNRFSYHAPKGDQARRYEELRFGAKVMALRIIESCPPSPERDTALTHLDSAVMFANASIARHE